MTELIRGGVATLFTFGYLGYLWTASFTWPLGIILSAYVMVVAFSLGRFSVFDVFLELPTAAELGLFIAWFVVNASVLPPLVPRLAYYAQFGVMHTARGDRDVDGGMRVETYGAQASAFGGPIFILGGAYTLAGVYGEDVSFTETLVYGIALLVVGVGFTIYGFYALFASPTRADRADGRYIIYLFLLACGPPLLYIAALPLDAFVILIFWVTWLVVITVITLIECSLLGVPAGGSTTSVPHENDPRYLRRERYPIRIIQRWVIVTALPPLVIFTLTWVVETFVGGVTTGDSLGAASAAVVGMAFVSLFFGGIASASRANSVAWFKSDDVEQQTGEPPNSETAGEARTRSGTRSQKRKQRGMGVDLRPLGARGE